MNIKLIGGNGFIGSRVFDMLQSKHNTQIIDISSYIGNHPYDHCDITVDGDKLIELLKDTDIVYMFAAISEATKNNDDPALSISTNIVGLHNVLAACVKNNVKRVVFSSTCWVYGECLDDTVDETSLLNVNVGSSMYTTTKICGEMIIKSYQQCFGLDYTILRYGTIYGEYANPRTAIATFIRNAKNNDTIYISSDGYRNFIHVDDIARVVASVVECYDKTCNETISVDGKQSYTLRDIIDIIKVKVKDLQVTYNNIDAIEYKGKTIRLHKAINTLNFKQHTDLREWIWKQLDEKL